MIDYDRRLWSSHLFDIRGSLVREIAARLTLIGSWTLAVELAFLACERYDLPTPKVPATMHTLVGVSLGLLLVFRTNASYDRWWEGRKLWGGIVNETRNLIRLALVHLKGDRATIERIAHRTIAFAYATMNQLRDTKSLGDAAKYFDAATKQQIESSHHPALTLATEITESIAESQRRGLIGEKAMFMLDQNVQLLIDYIGGCERIHKTPLPYAYIVHLRRALIIYLWTLPFAFWGDLRWWALPGVLAISFTFLGIEEIGVEIEDPFEGEPNDLPLEAICQTIENNLTAMLAENKA
jgi:putative membrane protein